MSGYPSGPPARLKLTQDGPGREDAARPRIPAIDASVEDDGNEEIEKAARDVMQVKT